MRTIAPVLAVAIAAGAAWAEEPAQALARGKLASDLGRYDEAAAAFAALAESPEASPEQRWEALVRLGVSRRELEDPAGSNRAFEDAWESRTQDPEDLRFLLQALGSPLPGDGRWEEVWRDVSVRFAQGAPPSVLWPGIPDRPCPRSGHDISLDFKDGNYQDIFRLFADITGFNVVVHPATQGLVTHRFNHVPWDQALCELLAPNGYAAQQVENVLWIGRPEEASQRTRFAGEPIDLHYRDVDLHDALSRIAAEGGARVEMAPGIIGRVTLRLVQVRWDQAFDVLANVNGLAWSREGDVLSVRKR